MTSTGSAFLGLPLDVMTMIVEQLDPSSRVVLASVNWATYKACTADRGWLPSEQKLYSVLQPTSDFSWTRFTQMVALHHWSFADKVEVLSICKPLSTSQSRLLKQMLSPGYPLLPKVTTIHLSSTGFAELLESWTAILSTALPTLKWYHEQAFCIIDKCTEKRREWMQLVPRDSSYESFKETLACSVSKPNLFLIPFFLLTGRGDEIHYCIDWEDLEDNDKSIRSSNREEIIKGTHPFWAGLSSQMSHSTVCFHGSIFPSSPSIASSLRARTQAILTHYMKLTKIKEHLGSQSTNEQIAQHIVKLVTPAPVAVAVLEDADVTEREVLNGLVQEIISLSDITRTIQVVNKAQQDSKCPYDEKRLRR